MANPRDPFPQVQRMDLVTWIDPLTGAERRGSSTERDWWMRNAGVQPQMPGSTMVRGDLRGGGFLGAAQPQLPGSTMVRGDLRGTGPMPMPTYTQPQLTNLPAPASAPTQPQAPSQETINRMLADAERIRQLPSMTTPQANVPTLQNPLAPSTYAPSQLASQESGAIGAASIASQMPKPKTSPFAQAAKPKPYSVQRGDTLSAIAAKNKMSLKQLMKLNPQFTQNKKYQGGNRIFSGTKVNLAPRPQKAPTTPASFNPGSFRLAENKGM